MKIKWKKQSQYTGYGFFRVGDVIDAAALGIPAAIIEAWIAGDWAELISEAKEAVADEGLPKGKPKRETKKNMEVKHG